MSSIPLDSRPQSNTAGKAAWICLFIAWVAFMIPLPGTSWLIGWPLNAVGFILAIVVMSRAGARSGIFPLLASLIVSPIIYFVGLALFTGGVAATAATANEIVKAEQQKQKTALIEAGPVAAVTATQLYREYDANEVAADNLYKGKRLEVTGRVESVDKDFTDNSYVVLSSEMLKNVYVRHLPDEVTATLKKGDKIVVECTGAGRMVTFPQLEDCVLK